MKLTKPATAGFVNLDKRFFNFTIGDKGIEELKNKFLIFLIKFINILYTVKGGGVQFSIHITNKPIQRHFKNFSHVGGSFNRWLHLITVITANHWPFCIKLCSQFFLSNTLFLRACISRLPNIISAI